MEDNILIQGKDLNLDKMPIADNPVEYPELQKNKDMETNETMETLETSDEQTMLDDIKYKQEEYLKNANVFNRNELQSAYFRYFSMFVVEDWSKLKTLYELSENVSKIGGKFKISQELYHEREIFQNLDKNLWDYIPDYLKEIKPIKKIKYEPTIDDKGLATLTKDFVANDELRPVMNAIHFEKGEGEASTDAHKLLWLYNHTKHEGNFCLHKHCKNTEESEGKKVSEIDFPRWRSVVPKSNTLEVVDIDADSLRLFLTTIHNTIKTHFTMLHYGHSNYGFNVVFLLEAILTMKRLGYNELSFGMGDVSRAMIIAPKGRVEKVDNFTTDFALLMPSMIYNELKGQLVFDLETQCVFSLEIEGEICLKPTELRHKKDLIEIKAEAKAEMKAEIKAERDKLKAEQKAEKEAGEQAIKQAEINRIEKEKQEIINNRKKKIDEQAIRISSIVIEHTEKDIIKPKQTDKSTIGYMLIDNISGEIIAVKKDLKELKQVYNNLEEGQIKGMKPLVYTVIKKGDKNVKDKKVDVDWVKQPRLIKNKEVKINQPLVISEVLEIDKYKDLDNKLAELLYDLYKDADADGVFEYGEDFWDEETADGKRLAKLEDLGYIEFIDGNPTLTSEGLSFGKAVDSRIETRKLLKQGSDLFPKEAGVKEYKHKLKKGGEIKQPKFEIDDIVYDLDDGKKLTIAQIYTMKNRKGYHYQFDETEDNYRQIENRLSKTKIKPKAKGGKKPKSHRLFQGVRYELEKDNLTERQSKSLKKKLVKSGKATLVRSQKLKGGYSVYYLKN